MKFVKWLSNMNIHWDALTSPSSAGCRLFGPWCRVLGVTKLGILTASGF